MDIAGPRAMLDEDEWTYRFLRARANSIEGGTTEILRTSSPSACSACRGCGDGDAMNFDFTDDQRAIKRTARDFLAARYKPETVRAIAEDRARLHRRAVGRAGRARLAGSLHPRGRRWPRAWASSSWS